MPTLQDDDFVQLFARSQRPLYGFIMGLVYRATDADDLLQEVNLALWRKRHTFDPRGDFLRWAIGFARLEVSNLRKKHLRNRMLFSEEAVDLLMDEWPGDELYQEQRLDALLNCVQKLGRREQRFIADFYQSDTPIQALAEQSKMPVSTVYKVLMRARESLRKCVQATMTQADHPSSSHPSST